MSAATMAPTCPDWCTADHKRVVSEIIETNRADVALAPEDAAAFDEVTAQDVADAMKWHEMLVHHSNLATVTIECDSSGDLVINTALKCGREFDLDEKAARTLAAALIVAADRMRQIKAGRA